MEDKPKIDSYVSRLIKIYGEELGVDIDSQNPTRESRLELALKIDAQADAKADPSSKWYAMEIMAGRKVLTEENALPMLFMAYISGAVDKMKFYGGFPE